MNWANEELFLKISFYTGMEYFTFDYEVDVCDYKLDFWWSVHVSCP